MLIFIVLYEGDKTKKILKVSFVFLLIGLLAGVFYREYTKIMGVNNPTSLSVLHTHILLLSVIAPILLGLILNAMKKSLLDIKPVWTLGYILSISGLFITLLIRGIVQSMNNTPSRALYNALSGIAGVTHIALAIFVSGIFIRLIKLSSNDKVVKE